MKYAYGRTELFEQTKLNLSQRFHISSISAVIIGDTLYACAASRTGTKTNKIYRNLRFQSL